MSARRSRKVVVEAHKRTDGTKVKRHVRVLKKLGSKLKEMGHKIAHMGDKRARVDDIKHDARMHRAKKNNKRVLDRMFNSPKWKKAA